MRKLALLAPLVLGLAACGNAPSAAEAAEAAPVDQLQTGDVLTIDSDALAARLAAGDVQLIDVRTPEEFAEGHIAGAINVPVDTFDPVMLPDAAGAERILYCRSDRRSGIAAERLAAHSGQDSVHLDGGILAWQEDGQPVAVVD